MIGVRRIISEKMREQIECIMYELDRELRTIEGRYLDKNK